MYPTRVTPLVRLFLHAARAYAARAATPPAVYVHDCVRAIAEADVLPLLSEKKILFTLSDALRVEEDRELRDTILMQSASVVAFSPHPSDMALAERIFFPFVTSEDFQKFSEGEA